MKVLGASLLLLLSACEARALTPKSVNVAYDVVYEQVSPGRALRRTSGTAGYAVVGDHLSSDGIGERAAYQFGQTAIFHLKNGVDYASVWSKRGDTITATNTYVGYTSVVTVNLLRSGSCLASVRYRRNPGERYFFFDDATIGARVYESSFRTENVTCRVTY